MSATPGPWDVRKVSVTWVLRDKKTYLLGEIYTSSVGDEEAEANARLIAAAPELAEACLALIRWQQDGDLAEAMDMAETALRKAGALGE